MDTPSEGPAAQAARAVSARPAGTPPIEYVVLEVLGPQADPATEDGTAEPVLVERWKGKAADREGAVAAAIKDGSGNLQARVDGGEELALLPIAARLYDPVRVKQEVKKELRFR